MPLVGLLVLSVGVWVVLAIARGDGQRETALDAAIKSADNAFQLGDFQKSSAELEKAVAHAKTDEEKIALYTSMAASAASAGKMSQAIEFMEQKHAIDRELVKSDAYLLGTYYERIGDTSEALEQYKIALAYQRSLPKSTTTDAKIRSLQARITSLGG
jgi:tetratricopeptide (TPR) repeat protein